VREFQDFGWRAEDVPDPQARSSFERSQLLWSEASEEPHRSLLAYHRALIGLRRHLAGANLEATANESARTLVTGRSGAQVRCDFDQGTVEIRPPLTPG
jgi:maltooligosyltrehalose trehalohydrolase